MFSFQSSSSSRDGSATTPKRSGAGNRTGKTKKSRMSSLFKGDKSKKAEKCLAEPCELSFDGKGSLESIQSIISAITLPDELLAPVPEAPPQTKFDSFCADCKPRRPARRMSHGSNV
ncbi:expressed unknown protein [Seminavis robusta]|uniref:Uncharacterized protein n=1 Tax=Seminavis robusta TaxID=568900 RepID=A0A9N8D7Q3_9STRA|nr:expressed unknown protein [Seminavis robusta]|eukprot:Sro23_g015630.1 n/a (117) ;mRNA; f:35670-36020